MPQVLSLDMFCDRDFRRWQAYVLSHPDAQYTDLGQWRRIFAELYGIRSLNFAYVAGDRVRGVASLYLIASPFFGRLLVTCPFFGHGGLYADDLSVQQALLARVEQAAEELDVDFVEFRLRSRIGEPYRIREDFLEFELPLAESAEEVWQRSLSSNARQNVRKSERYSLAFSTSRDANETFLLLSTTIRDLGTPFHSRRFFDLLLEHLGQDVQFSQVRLQGRLVAAGIMVRFRDRLATPYIGSLKRYGATSANYCQYWGIIKHCIDSGIRHFDLGRSPRGSSVAKFKRKWGANPVPMPYAHRAFSTRRTYRSVLEPGRLESLVSAAWKQLPLALTRRLGHLASHYIP